MNNIKSDYSLKVKCHENFDLKDNNMIFFDLRGTKIKRLFIRGNMSVISFSAIYVNNMKSDIFLFF